MNSLIITRYKNQIVTAMYDHYTMLEASLHEEEASFMLGNIYVGRVEKVVKSIQAAFVEVLPGLKCYYSLPDNPNSIFCNGKNTSAVCEGDLLLVQVEREAVKTKAPIVSSYLNCSGTYVAITRDRKLPGCNISVSNKITPKKQETILRNFLKQVVDAEPLMEKILSLDSLGVQVVARTNCEELLTKGDLAPLQEEFTLLVKRYYEILLHAPTRKGCTCMYQMEPEYVKVVRDTRMEELSEVVTDLKEVYDLLKELPLPSLKEKLRLYQDDLLPLDKCYSLAHRMEEALRKNVWLKSGGYLVIEPTEALTVIDVNTGKYIDPSGVKKGLTKEAQEAIREKGFFKINCEAAVEIAAQLRLRNYSGIILVDFIDLSSKEHEEALLELLEQELQKDRVKTRIIDITGLGLVEITRKKVKKPLHEQLKK